MPTIILKQVNFFLECSPFFDSNRLICFVFFHRERKYSRSPYLRKRRYTSQFLKYLPTMPSVHIIQQQKLGSRLQWDLIKTLDKIAESAVLCCSQQNRDLLDLHIVVTNLFYSAHLASWISNLACHICEQMVIGGEFGTMLAVTMLSGILPATRLLTIAEVFCNHACYHGLSQHSSWYSHEPLIQTTTNLDSSTAHS